MIGATQSAAGGFSPYLVPETLVEQGRVERFERQQVARLGHRCWIAREPLARGEQAPEALQQRRVQKRAKVSYRDTRQRARGAP